MGSLHSVLEEKKLLVAWSDAQSIICFALVFAPSPPHPSTDAPCQRSFFATTDILPIGIFTTTTITCNSSSRPSSALEIAKQHRV